MATIGIHFGDEPINRITFEHSQSRTIVVECRQGNWNLLVHTSPKMGNSRHYLESYPDRKSAIDAAIAFQGGYISAVRMESVKLPLPDDDYVIEDELTDEIEKEYGE